MGSLDPVGVSAVDEVAVIGAGISGIATAAHLLRQGLRVTVFERSSIAGGVWHYDPRRAREPAYPNTKAPTPNKSEVDGLAGGSQLTTQGDVDDVSILHAPPGPCYAGLRNNVPTSLMRSTLMNWPEGTDEFVGQEVLEKYIQDLAAFTGAQEHIHYDTSVDAIFKNKDSSKWNVRTRTLRRTGPDYEFLGRNWELDAVVVAAGHYHEPRIPDIPGLKEWKERFPENITHSKVYRTPEPFKDKTVLLIGAGVSSLDIARECNDIAKKIYQSTRDGQFDLPENLLPPNADRVGGIDHFIPPADAEGSNTSGTVVLKDGSRVENVDAIVLGTGYITSYPFLGPLQAPLVRAEEADSHIIVSGDGSTTHNLHRDVWYIPDPTLVFVGVPFYTSTYSLFDFQAEVVARFFAGKFALPPRADLEREYDERKRELVGGSKTFHSLFQKEVAYMNEILAMVNKDATARGIEPMRGVDNAWLERYEHFLNDMKKRRAFGQEADKQRTAERSTDKFFVVGAAGA